MPVTPPLTLALVNDYDVVVQGLARMLEPFDSRVQVVELTASGPSRAPADIALYDTFATDLAFGPEVKAQHLVLYTVHTSPEFMSAARAGGADGVLSKALHSDELVGALERIRDGEILMVGGPQDAESRGTWPAQATGLTEREAEIIALITQGLRNDEIADALYLSKNTVKSYIRSAYRKMNVESRSHAVLWGVDHGFAKRSSSWLTPEVS
jgi:two-component system, NarL family, response regulator LiaR